MVSATGTIYIGNEEVVCARPRGDCPGAGTDASCRYPELLKEDGSLTSGSSASRQYFVTITPEADGFRYRIDVLATRSGPAACE